MARGVPAARIARWNGSAWVRLVLGVTQRSMLFTSTVAALRALDVALQACLFPLRIAAALSGLFQSS